MDNIKITIKEIFKNNKGKSNEMIMDIINAVYPNISEATVEKYLREVCEETAYQYFGSRKTNCDDLDKYSVKDKIGECL